MDRIEFLMEAEYLAALHPENELSAVFLDAIRSSESTEDECVNLASRLIMELYPDS